MVHDIVSNILHEKWLVYQRVTRPTSYVIDLVLFGGKALYFITLNFDEPQYNTSTSRGFEYL